MFPTLKRHQTTTKHQYTSRGVVASPTIQVTALIDTKNEIIREFDRYPILTGSSILPAAVPVSGLKGVA